MNKVQLPKMERTPSLTDSVTDELRKRLDGGEFKAGDRLPSGAELATALGVSLGVVREALSRLKHDGLVEMVQGLGCFVTDRSNPRAFRLDGIETTTPAVISSILELRLALEQSAAELAARRRTAPHLKALAIRLKEIDKAIDQGESANNADQDFHRTIMDATGNPLFLELWNFLSAHVNTSISTARAHSATVAGYNEQAQKEHRAIFKAIEGSNPEVAARAAARHVRGAGARLGIKI